MSINGSKLYLPIRWDEVTTILDINEDTQDIGHFNQGARDDETPPKDRINKWARYKPVVFPSWAPLSKANLSSVLYGLVPMKNTLLKAHSDIYDSGAGTVVANAAQMQQILDSHQEWGYTMPSGTAAQPFRIFDWGPPSDENQSSYGYDHSTQAPVSNIYSWTVNLSDIKNTADSQRMATGSNGGNIANWILSTDETEASGHPASPLFTSLAFRFGEGTPYNIGGAPSNVISLTELLDNTGTVSTNKHWRMALAVQVPTSLTSLTYMQYFMSRASIWRIQNDGISSSNAYRYILPSMGTNQWLCKTIFEHRTTLLNAGANDSDLLGNKKLTASNPIMRFPALLCTVNNTAMSVDNRTYQATVGYHHCKICADTGGSLNEGVYAAPGAITAVELIVLDDIDFSQSQILAYSYVSITLENTGRVIEMGGGSATKTTIYRIVRKILKVPSAGVTVNVSYSIHYEFTNGYSGGRPIRKTGTLSGSVAITSSSSLDPVTLYEAPALEITDYTMSGSQS